jgi:hypothetical protein
MLPIAVAPHNIWLALEMVEKRHNDDKVSGGYCLTVAEECLTLVGTEGKNILIYSATTQSYSTIEHNSSRKNARPLDHLA